MNGSLKSALRSEAFVLFIVVLLGLTTLSIFTSQFLVVFNIYVLLYNIALAAIVAYAQMVVVATGGLNLALGATGALSGVIMGMLMEWYGMPLPVVIVAGLAAGALMGWINGFLTVKTGINPFIITLATASAYTGTTMAITNANPFYGIYDSVLSWAQARTGIFPWPAVVTIAVALLLERIDLEAFVLPVAHCVADIVAAGLVDFVEVLFKVGNLKQVVVFASAKQKDGLALILPVTHVF